MKSKATVIAFLIGTVGGLLLCGAAVAIWRMAHGRPQSFDMTEGTVVTYEIDPQGLSEEQMQDLSSRMIAAMRKRVDPKGKLPLVWEPRGYMGIEITMPMPRPEAYQKREAFEAAMAELVALNVSSAPVAGTFPDPLASEEARQAAVKERFDRLLSGLARRQVESILEMPSRSERADRIAQLKDGFPDRAGLIDKVAAAFDAYRPLRGPLDHPRDIDRVLRSLGILEFRVLPVWDNLQEQRAEIERYLTALAEKGPQPGRADKYVWCEIDEQDQEPWWRHSHAITAVLDDTRYVLACNDSAMIMLRRPGRAEWELKMAKPTTDGIGRRAIAFELDTNGGDLFHALTGANIGKPIAIIIDDRVISAPNVQSAIGSQGTISGVFTSTQVSEMIDRLNGGSLPARLRHPPRSVTFFGNDYLRRPGTAEKIVPPSGPNGVK